MKRDEVIKLAKKAGGRFDGSDWRLACDFDDDDLLTFANLVAESVVPEGYVLVPVEPTPRMIAAAWAEYNRVGHTLARGLTGVADKAAYRAMLAAAPSKEEQ